MCDFLAVLFAILLPPLGVFLKKALGIEFWISLLLTILGYFPGLLFSLYVVIVAIREDAKEAGEKEAADHGR